MSEKKKDAPIPTAIASVTEFEESEDLKDEIDGELNSPDPEPELARASIQEAVIEPPKRPSVVLWAGGNPVYRD